MQPSSTAYVELTLLLKLDAPVMNKSLHTKILCFTRWFVLLSVFAGLFFSNAEGVQLLPFPDSENEQNETSLPVENNLKSYAYSIYQPASFRFECSLKFQKKLNFHNSDSALNTGQRIIIPHACCNSEQESNEARIFPILYFSTSISNRAPPVT